MWLTLVGKSKVPSKPHGPQGGADLRFFSPQSQTSLHCLVVVPTQLNRSFYLLTYCETMDTGLAHRAVCLFTPQLLLVLTAPTHRGMARLS